MLSSGTRRVALAASFGRSNDIAASRAEGKWPIGAIWLMKTTFETIMARARIRLRRAWRYDAGGGPSRGYDAMRREIEASGAWRRAHLPVAISWPLA